MSGEDEIHEISVRYETIEDYLNCRPLEQVDVDLATNAEDIELVFNKPIFDMAFIITHSSLIPKIADLQKVFQSQFGFTTHCVLLAEVSKLKFCIRDLKLHEITYAIVVNERSFITDNMDIYILYPNIEVQKNMSLNEIKTLVTDDAENITEQVKHLKNNLKRNPHPVNEKGEELYKMNDQYRYYFSLLADNRMLSMDELETLKDYLVFRHDQLQQTLKMHSTIFEERPLEACRQEHLKYYIYEPISNDIAKQLTDKDKYLKGATTKNTIAEQRPSINFTVASNKPAPHLPIVSMNQLVTKSLETQSTFRARTIINRFNTNVEPISGVDSKSTTVKPISYVIIRDTSISKCQLSAQNDSEDVQYKNTTYFLSQPDTNTVNEEVISLSSGTLTPPLDYELLPVSPPSPMESSTKPAEVEIGKRKSTEPELEKCKPPKIYVMDLSKPDVETPSTIIKNCPENLLNLFRLILSMAPLTLPHDNAIVNILSNCCNELQDGILVPSLKIVKMDYDNCKNHGVNEIIESIYGIYDSSKKTTENFSDMDYVWGKYFPDHISNFNILIAFYRFVKLLILFKLFNNKLDCMNKVLGVLEKINTIANFDFNLPVMYDQKHLNCFPQTFHTYYQESDQLHVKYPLSTECPLRLADSDKKLDSSINQKKIEFAVGPLLHYFINSINSIHQQMDLTQIIKIYNAIRTLRFCLRKIFPISSNSSVFYNPKVFNPNSEKQAAYYKDISDELKWLMEEIKYYQCVLFTALHYEFVNSLLDFSFMVEEIIDSGSESYKPISNLDSLIVLDSVQFINSFSSSQFVGYQYHPDSEIQFLKNALRDNWIHTLHNAFKGVPTERNENRIIKEINNLLPVLWGLRTFDEAVTEAAKLYYSDWNKVAQNDRSGWYEKFSKTKFAGIVWLNMYHLPYTKAVEELQKYENMLKNEFPCS